MNEHSIHGLFELIQSHEEWLMERILAYAVKYATCQILSV